MLSRLRPLPADAQPLSQAALLLSLQAERLKKPAKPRQLKVGSKPQGRQPETEHATRAERDGVHYTLMKNSRWLWQLYAGQQPQRQCTPSHAGKRMTCDACAAAAYQGLQACFLHCREDMPHRCQTTLARYSCQTHHRGSRPCCLTAQYPRDISALRSTLARAHAGARAVAGPNQRWHLCSLALHGIKYSLSKAVFHFCIHTGYLCQKEFSSSLAAQQPVQHSKAALGLRP